MNISNIGPIRPARIERIKAAKKRGIGHEQDGQNDLSKGHQMAVGHGRKHAMEEGKGTMIDTYA